MQFRKIYQFLFPNEQNLKCQSNLIVLGFFGTAMLYVLRFNLSVAIVAMVGHSKSSVEKPQFEGSCPLPPKSYKLDQKQDDSTSFNSGEIEWDKKVQGRIHASFFYGYLVTNFVGGRLADRFGGKRIFGGGILLTSLLAFSLPAAARHSEGLFSLIRIIQGLTEGVTFPAMQSLTSNWVQPSRRAFFMSRFNLGIFVGPVFITSIGGWLSQTWLGWASIFYLSGLLGLIWSVAWFRGTSDHPNSHPFISEEERMFLEQEIGKAKLKLKSNSIPWKSIFTSRPYLATVIAHFGSNFGFYYLLTELPTYLSTVHHFKLKNNGLVSSLPYIIAFIFSIVYSSCVHNLAQSNSMPIRRIRMMSTGLGTFVPMMMLMSVSLAECNSVVVVTLICLAVCFSSCNKCGFICSFQDLAPNYSGTLCGISNTFATIPGFLAPIITGAIINDQPTIGQWNKVFMISSLFYLVSGTTYLRYMSSEIQEWNN